MKDKYSMDALTSGFKLFWRGYPRKIGKYQAWKLWVTMDLEPQAGFINAKTRDYPWSADKQYIMHPQTYLRNFRWLDEFEEEGENDSW